MGVASPKGKPVSISCSEIAEAIGAELLGDGNTIITSIASIDSAPSGSITFITGKKYVGALQATEAAAVILPSSFADETSITRLVMDNPYLGYARLTGLWVSRSQGATGTGLHESCCIEESALLAADVRVGPKAVVQANAALGESVTVGGGAFVGEGAVIGARTVVHPNATVLHGCTIGSDCEIHSGAVIGSDGFGFAPGGEYAWEKIHQLGGVRIGNRVSIGACTTIDRGALEDTEISDGVILDNHIQVAHNVSIGANTAIAGCTGIAGSTSIGANCRIGGAVSIVGHISICDDVMITANSFVNNSVTRPGSYSSGYPLEPTRQWRKNAVRLHRLDEYSRQLARQAGRAPAPQVGKLKS